MEANPTDFLTTSEAAVIAGVGVSSIKRWSDQRLIRTARTPGGHRRVVRASLVSFLRQSVDSESSVTDAGQLIRDTNGVEHDETAKRWASDILTNDLHSLQAALWSARGRLGSWYRAVDEVGQGVKEIGSRWRSGEVSSVQEHIASEQLSRALASIADAMPGSPENPVCLLACAEGETHTLGLSMLQPCLREAGWACLWVGATTPSAELCDVIRNGAMSMVALSASAASSDAKTLATQVTDVSYACRSARAELVLGGDGAWPEAPTYARRFRDFASFHTFVSNLR